MIVNDKLAHIIARASASKDVHELAIVAQNVKTGEQASGFVGQIGGRDIGPDTHYYLASATKLFVCALMMQMIEKSQIAFDAPIADFFTPGQLEGLQFLNLVEHTTKITVESLLAHTSGLPDYFEQKQADGLVFARDILESKDRFFDLDGVIGMVRSMKPAFAPSTPGRAFYSDTNYQLQTAIIEKISGMTFAQTVAKKIAAGP